MDTYEDLTSRTAGFRTIDQPPQGTQACGLTSLAQPLLCVHRPEEPDDERGLASVRGYLWTEGYLWAEAYLWTNVYPDGYLWTEALTETTAVNWVGQEWGHLKRA